jgi:hypothetical protein
MGDATLFDIVLYDQSTSTTVVATYTPNQLCTIAFEDAMRVVPSRMVYLAWSIKWEGRSSESFVDGLQP